MPRFLIVLGFLFLVLLASCSELPVEDGAFPGGEIEDPPLGFQGYLAFDSIRPIYEPEFVPAVEAPYLDEELIIGVAIGDQAKAYSVSVLKVREMVNDELAGIPILVTW